MILGILGGLFGAVARKAVTAGIVAGASAAIPTVLGACDFASMGQTLGASVGAAAFGWLATWLIPNKKVVK